LRKLLERIATMRLPTDGPLVEVVVIDNDATGSARIFVESISPTYSLPLRYALESQSGVSFARNRAVGEARGEWIAFIDDDEWPEQDWLAELWKLAAAGRYDGVFGPVLTSFEHEPPVWAVNNGAFERPRPPTGTLLDWRDCASGNVLFKRSLHQELGGFDVAFASSGAEDSEFFCRGQRRGARFAWCNEAVAIETVPASRLTKQWLIRRAINGGRNYVRIVARHEGPLRAFDVVLRGAVGFFGFGLLALLAKLTARPEALDLECRAMAGYGKLTAFWAQRVGAYGAGGTL
jgi:glycosyltransferase involved in cell wall biosynthesis